MSAWGTPTLTAGHYYLVWPGESPTKPQVAHLVEWLQGIV
ncbi:hypothetical protein [uncultured Roseobacter sp.]|nr:hypothetical protein [uncultured Roseobacter sp.]